MLLILNGNSEIGTHVKSNLCYLVLVIGICSDLKAVTNRIFSSEKTYFSACGLYMY